MLGLASQGPADFRFSMLLARLCGVSVVRCLVVGVLGEGRGAQLCQSVSWLAYTAYTASLHSLVCAS